MQFSPNFKIGVLSSGKIFEDYVYSIKLFFENRNINCELINKSLPNFNIIIVVNPVFFHEMKFFDNISYYGIQTEQITSSNEYSIDTGLSNLVILKSIINKYKAIFDWSHSSWTILNRIYSDRYFYLRHGFLDKYIAFENISDRKEVYDVCFIGWETGIDNRRKIIIDELKKKFIFYPKSNGLWGDEKINAIQQSKIILNIHFDFSLAMENPRFYEVFASKKLLISEDVFDSSPFKKNKDFVVADQYNLEKKIEYYLFNENERMSIARNGYLKAIENPFDECFSVVFSRITLDYNTNKTKHSVKRIIYKNHIFQLMYLFFLKFKRFLKKMKKK